MKRVSTVTLALLAVAGNACGSNGVEADAYSGDAAASDVLVPSGDAGGSDAPKCDPTSSPRDNACVLALGDAIFVSPDGADGNVGSMSSPVATLGHALDLAATTSKRVFACASAGAYTESLVVDGSRDGISVYGGLDCSTSSWAYDGRKLATIAPSARGYALRVTGLIAGVTFADFAFKAQAGIDPGESSIAVFVANSSNVLFQRTTLTALDGVAGLDQPAVAPFDTGAPNGQPGTQDAAGAETLNECPGGAVSTGGAGGPPAANGSSGERGLPGPDNSGSDTACKDPGRGGGSGLNGDAGASGSGAQILGNILDAGWSPKAGQPGGSGGIGQGGGGGGSVGNSGGGGGGGAGGCGGAGGMGGGGGGSSIGILCLNTQVDLENCILIAGTAGRGGNGAMGQSGQTGGFRGPALGPSGCPGGIGGSGGGGGGGGGGAGGISAGILWTGSVPIVDGLTVTDAPSLSRFVIGGAGAAGSAGPGGTAQREGQAAGNQGSSGLAGVAGAVVPLP